MTTSARPPRIGYLLRAYPRFSQTFIVNEILELERQGVAIRIGSLRRPTEGMFHESVSRVQARCDYLPDTLIGNGSKAAAANWDRLKSATRGYMSGLRDVLRFGDVSFFDLIQAALVCRWARKHKLDHLHVHFGTSEATVAWLARRMGGPSYSLTLHAFDIFRDNVNRRLLAQKINGSRFTVTVCESNRRFMVEHLPGVQADKIRVNYNGIDLDRFSADDRPREPLSIFAVGRLIEKKGFAHLVRAVGLLRDSGLDVRCRIAGDGPEEAPLRAEIARLDLAAHVKLVGPLRQDDVREQMRRSACVVLPCVQAKDGNVDALPTVLLESMACQCPTISTRISGVPEIIEHGRSGLLVEPQDDAGLAEAIRAALTDESLARRLAEGGRRRAEERFDGRRAAATMRAWLLDEPAPVAAAPRVAAQPALREVA